MYEYRIFPEQNITIVRYVGVVRFEEIARACQEIVQDPDFKPDYKGLSDERRATIIMSREEIARLAKLIQEISPLSGRWAHIIDTPRSAVSASEYGRYSAEFHENNFFSTVEATAEYLDIPELEKYLAW